MPQKKKNFGQHMGIEGNSNAQMLTPLLLQVVTTPINHSHDDDDDDDDDDDLVDDDDEVGVLC